MQCPECGNEMRIYNAETRPERQQDEMVVYHVAISRCINDNCNNQQDHEEKTEVWRGKPPL